jgi:hypothetical protein
MFGIKRLRRENAALRDALGWYAESANWRRSATNKPGEARQWIKSPASFDRGARAKFVLATLAAPLLRQVWKFDITPEAKSGAAITISPPLASGESTTTE